MYCRLVINQLYESGILKKKHRLRSSLVTNMESPVSYVISHFIHSYFYSPILQNLYEISFILCPLFHLIIVLINLSPIDNHLLLLSRFYSYLKYNILTKCSRVYIWSRTHDSKVEMKCTGKNIIARDKRKTMKQRNDLTHASHCQPVHRMSVMAAIACKSLSTRTQNVPVHRMSIMAAITCKSLSTRTQTVYHGSYRMQVIVNPYTECLYGSYRMQVIVNPYTECLSWQLYLWCRNYHQTTPMNRLDIAEGLAVERWCSNRLERRLHIY